MGESKDNTVLLYYLWVRGLICYVGSGSFLFARQFELGSAVDRFSICIRIHGRQITGMRVVFGFATQENTIKN